MAIALVVMIIYLFLRNIPAVSYTHLDVYKRQVIRRLPVQGIHRISLLIRFQHKRYSDVTLCFHIPVVATATFR